MLAHRLRRWPNIVPTLGECIVFAGGVLSQSEMNDAFTGQGETPET